MAGNPHDYLDVEQTFRCLIRLGLFAVADQSDSQLEAEIEVLPIEACRDIMTSRLLEAANDVRGFDADVISLQRQIYDVDPDG